MRVFHFLNAKYGLEGLRKRRLKIATLNELNDPFEFFGVNLADKKLRRTFQAMKQDLADKRGLLCFSRNWHNPLLWNHYADRHTGLCLGFDVPDKHLGPVTYLKERLDIDNEVLHQPNLLPPHEATKLLFTKYEHWHYEDEVRTFVTIKDRDPEKGMYFAEFSESLQLAKVIVGANSEITRQKISDALGDLATSVEALKARLAFKSFRVVRQRNSKLWK